MKYIHVQIILTSVSPGCIPARMASTCVGVKGIAFLEKTYK